MNEILNSGDTFLKNEIVEVVALYGIPKEEPKDKIIGILSKLIIPLIFIIGIIVYMKKSKRTTKQKVIIVTLFSICIILMWIAGVMIYNL